ncbi:MAG: hypothetical protein IJ113_02640 [Eggerthellaceae bacterium]|nr:hypothetical protein [Eggerthellaceae bacterium]
MTTFGTFFELGGRGVMEALGNVGLDYVIIDTEHGPFSDESVADYILAAERHGLLPFVRIGDTRRPYVLRMADIGARGLVVPNIRSIDQVKELVDAAKFAPIGSRGFCPNRTSAWGAQDWAADAESYMAQSNERLKVIPQCETIEALECVEEIAALEGVDGIFVGPFDLSIGMGVPLQLDHPDMLAAIERILAACKVAGKESYIFTSSIEDSRSWIERGFDSVTYSLDASILANAYKQAVAAIRNH